MERFFLFCVLVAVATANHSRYCESDHVKHVRTHAVRGLVDDYGYSEEPVAVSLCRSTILKTHEIIALDFYHNYMNITDDSRSKEEKEPVHIIKNDTFSNLGKLEHLTLEGLGLEELEPHAFRGLDDLKFLSLEGNRLTSLPVEMFEDLPSLKELNVRFNRIRTVGNRLFDKATSLQRLSVDANGLIFLPANWNRGLSNLEHLSVSINIFYSLPTAAFDGLSKLKELALDMTRFFKVEKDAFKGMDNLEYISMLGCGAMDFNLTHELQEHLKSLKELHMTFSSIRCDDVDSARSILENRSIDYTVDFRHCWPRFL